jgi:hypothetical protein
LQAEGVERQTKMKVSNEQNGKHNHNHNHNHDDNDEEKNTDHFRVQESKQRRFNLDCFKTFKS